MAGNSAGAVSRNTIPAASDNQAQARHAGRPRQNTPTVEIPTTSVTAVNPANTLIAHAAASAAAHRARGSLVNCVAANHASGSHAAPHTAPKCWACEAKYAPNSNTVAPSNAAGAEHSQRRKRKNANPPANATCNTTNHSSQ